jgi:hypothetical protein
LFSYALAVFSKKGYQMSGKEQKDDFHYEEQVPEKGAQLGRRRFLQKTGLVAGIASFASALSLTPFSPVHAASNASGGPQELSKAKAESYIRKTVASHDYQLFKTHLRQQEYAGVLTVQEHEATAIQFSSYVIVRIPVAGGAGFSGFGAVFQKDTGAFVSTLASLNVLMAERDIHVTMFQNGKKGQDMVLSPAGVVVKRSTEELAQSQMIPQDYNQFVACVRNCLDSAGISGWIVGLVLAACSFFCAIQAVPACIACYAGYYVYLGARGLGCVYTCSSKFL